jgi:hypothetical protein
LFDVSAELRAEVVMAGVVAGVVAVMAPPALTATYESKMISVYGWRLAGWLVAGWLCLGTGVHVYRCAKAEYWYLLNEGMSKC